MWQKAIRPISCVLMVALAGSVSAQTFQWDNGGETSLWSVAENWEPDGIPTAADIVQVYLPDANCVIDSTVAAECWTVSVGSTSDGTCYLDMTGGTLNVATPDTAANGIQIGQNSQGTGVFIMSGGLATAMSRLEVGVNGTGTFIMRDGILDISGDKIEIGKNANGVGKVYVEGGVINLTGPSADLEIGSYGTGTFQMTGGLVTIEDLVKLSQGSPTSTTGRSYLNLYGGVLDANGLRNPSEGIYGKPKIDVTEGTLLLPGDYRAIVNEYIGRGWLVAYNGQGLVNVVRTTDPNRTTVTGRKLPPELASNPTPRDRKTLSKPVVLSWKPGAYALSHDVYFGTDFNDVNDADRSNPLDVLVSQGQDANSYAPPASSLTLCQTYYWRVDGIDDANSASPWKGAVFQFTVASYINLEDFESYNEILQDEPGSNLVYFTWFDGYENPAVNGGTIGYVSGNSLETTNVHGGLQSVPVTYNNTVAPSSEVSVKLATLPMGTDWSGDGLATLSLWFYGDPLNSAEQMYVKLNGVKAAYNGAAADLQQPFWREWLISLDAFGIDLSNVTDLAIGFEKSGGAGGTGMVWFDDLRLTTVVLDTSSELLARWALNSTTTTSSSASDKVTAPAETVTSLYVIRDYGGIDGSQRVYASGSGLGYWPDETAENLDRYAQFSVTPKAGVSLKVTSISLLVGNSGGSTDVKASIFYSTDGFVTSTPLDVAIALPSSALQQQTYTPSVQVPNGKTFSLRVYPWLQGGRASGKYFNIKDVAISGTISQ
jgi:hypothetical protein